MNLPVSARTAVLYSLLSLGAAAPGASAQTWSGREANPGLSGFGAAVAVGDGEVFVGEARNVMRPGIVYVYRRGARGWVEQGQIKASSATFGDGFGSGLAVDGNTLAVGASTQKAIFIFTRQANGTWREVVRISSPDTASNTGFGTALALKGDLLLAGAANTSGGVGAVHVFRRAGSGAWAGVQSITAPDGVARDQFGSAISFDGTRAAIGAPGRNAASGMVYLFTPGATFAPAGTLAMPRAQGPRAGGAAPGTPQPAPAPVPAAFGASLRLDGGRLYVGAPANDGGVGSLFVYQWDGANRNWAAAGRLLPFDGAPQQSFGNAVALSGNSVLVGATGGFRTPGSVYVFEREANGDRLSGVRRLFAPDTTRGITFANAIAAGANVVVVGAQGQDSGAGTAVIYDITGASGTWAGSTVDSPAEALPPIAGAKVDCTDGKAHQLFQCGEVDLMGFLPVSAIGGGRGVNLNDIWGWTDPQTGKEYALIGRTDGTAFVDMTEPTRPIYVGEIRKTKGSPNAAWRDIKTYRDHAFIVADASGEHGMQVFDLARLRTYRGTPITFQPDTTYHNIASAHNIVINEESGFAYPVGSGSGGESCGGGLHMVDIRDPRHPKFAGCFADPQTGRAGTGYSHDAQCVIYKGPDRDYLNREICLGSNETMLSIADVTDKTNPKAISRIGYPNVGYTHQGWLTDDHRYFLMDDEGDEIAQSNAGTPLPGTRTLIWDLTDLDDPQLVKEFFGTTKASDHNLYIKGNLVFESNYASGLRILDISDVKNPREVGFFDTVPWGDNNPGFTGSWSNYPYFKSGNLAVTSIREGLFIVKYRQPRPIS
jgi:choice-of-anchor B domain-containing protein